MRSKAKWTCCVVAILGLIATGSQAAVFVNGGFEDGDPGGWAVGGGVTASGGIVTMGELGHPAASEGSKSLYYKWVTYTNQKSDFTYYQTDLNVPSQWRVTMDWYLTSYAGKASGWLQTDGFDANGIKKVQALYWWGGVNWSAPTGAPGDVPAVDYYKLLTKVGDAVGSWQSLAVNVPADVDTTFGPGTWASFDVTNITLSVASWANLDGASSIEGYFDNVQLVPEPATMAMLAFGGIGLLVRRRQRA